MVPQMIACFIWFNGSLKQVNSRGACTACSCELTWGHMMFTPFLTSQTTKPLGTAGYRLRRSCSNLPPNSTTSTLTHCNNHSLIFTNFH